jgi:hypothetical protein
VSWCVQVSIHYWPLPIGLVALSWALGNASSTYLISNNRTGKLGCANKHMHSCRTPHCRIRGFLL